MSNAILVLEQTNLAALPCDSNPRLSTTSLSHVGVSILGSTNTVSVIPLAQVRSGATEAQELLELERAKVLELAKENEVQWTSLTSQIETL